MAHPAQEHPPRAGFDLLLVHGRAGYDSGLDARRAASV